MCTHTCIHTCILDLGSFVLDLICILPLDIRLVCFGSHIVTKQLHAVNGFVVRHVQKNHLQDEKRHNKNNCSQGRTTCGSGG